MLYRIRRSRKLQLARMCQPSLGCMDHILGIDALILDLHVYASCRTTGEFAVVRLLENFQIRCVQKEGTITEFSGFGRVQNEIFWQDDSRKKSAQHVTSLPSTWTVYGSLTKPVFLVYNIKWHFNVFKSCQVIAFYQPRVLVYNYLYGCYFVIIIIKLQGVHNAVLCYIKQYWTRGMDRVTHKFNTLFIKKSKHLFY